MNVFARLRLRRAAKRYAWRLPTTLARDFGASETYTKEQIQSAIARARLDPAFTVLALATYMKRPDFEKIVSETAFCLAYDEARQLFLEFLPAGLSSDVGNAVDSNYVIYAGGDVSHD